MGECIIDTILRVVLFFRLQDYLLCVVCGFVAFGVSKVRPHCRPFSWNDSTIAFAYGGAGTFPSWTLPIISILPAVVYVLGEAVRHLWWAQRSGRLAAERQQGRQEMRARTKPTTTAPGRSASPYSAPTPPPPPPQEQTGVASSPKPPLAPVMVEAGEAEEEGDATAAVKRPQLSLGTIIDDNVTNAREGEQRSDAGGIRSNGSPVVESTRGLTHRAATASPLGAPSPSSPVWTSEGVVRVPYTRAVEEELRYAVPLRAPWQRFLAHAHMWVLTQAFAVTFAMLVVDTIKVYAGRLRPDFLARLQREGLSETSVGVDWCAAGKGGRVSFPSGHSAISFAAFVPFSFYVLHTLHVFRRGGASLWGIVVGLLPLILPITVAVSRTRDNRHNFDDILAGSLIGIASALMGLGANLSVNGRTGQLVPRLSMRDK